MLLKRIINASFEIFANYKPRNYHEYNYKINSVIISWDLCVTSLLTVIVTDYNSYGLIIVHLFSNLIRVNAPIRGAQVNYNLYF